ncbi:MAG: ATP-dependent DNA helicase RecG, partial [Bdellovibrionales bacterium]|nr:ATP-dependent DNA helicase RecG [Bdellovibrionales bacterium]
MAINIDTPIQYLKGVGPKLGDILAKRDIRSVNDLLEWYPRAYEDRRAAQNISDLVPGRMVSLKAQVVQVRSAFLGRSRRKMYEIVVQDKSGRISCKYFRVPYKGYFERFESGSLVRIIGKVTEYRSRREFHHPDIHVVQIDEVDENRLVPLYTETEGLSFQKLNRLLNSALEQLTQKSNSGIPDPFPSWIREKYQLVSRSEALTQIHHPPLHEAGEFLKFRSPSQRRLIFEEFFWMELNLAFRRSGIQKENAPPIITEESKLSQLTQNLPFALTSAQRRSAQEIIKDLRKPHPMHRLLQGDVGSGKTLLALLSSVYSAFAGFQSALMVPTEILAEQHFQNAQRLLAPLNFRVGLLTGSMKPKEREEVLSQLQSGEVHLCIGTHALIQENVKFQKLGLVIIDEQHRFGVQQRHLLKQKGVSPHFLVMTATPIPRTLALSVYGDLDVSVIDEMPKGRQPIVTRKAYESKRGQVFEFVRGQLAKGRQAYVVYPLI